MDLFGLDYDKWRNKRMVEKYPIPYISYSQLNSYMNCPESYRLTYLSGGFTPSSNKYTELGSVLHDVFERQGKHLISENPFMIEDAIKMFNVDFMKIDKKHFADKADWIKMYQKGIEAIRNYYSVYSTVIPLYVEKQFKIVVGEGIPPVKGFVDRIEGDPADASTWVITDYKSGSSPKSKDYLRADIQLGLYASQVYAQHGAYPQAVQFYHPVPDKFQTAIHEGDGHYKFTGQRAPVVEFSVADTLIVAKNTVEAIIKDIEQETFRLQADAWSCKMCFHFQSGKCKPFDKQQEGWSNV